MIYAEHDERGFLVGSDGRVYKEINQWTDRYGYKYITFGHKNLAVHRVIAKHFVPRMREEDNVVMHADNNPANNDPSNLSWGTYSQNNYDAYRDGLKTRNVPVRCMETGEEFQSAHDAASKIFGKPKRGEQILKCVRGGRDKAFGFHWEVIRP